MRKPGTPRLSLGFKNTNGQCQDIQFTLILTSIIFHTEANVISSKRHRNQDSRIFLEGTLRNVLLTLQAILVMLHVGVMRGREVLQGTIAPDLFLALVKPRRFISALRCVRYMVNP